MTDVSRETRLWQFHIPAPLEFRAKKTTGELYQAARWFNANHHLTPRKRNDLTQVWREAALVRARQLKLPKDVADRVFIEAIIHPDSKRYYDAQNLYPTAKAIVDGLVTGNGKIRGYGLLADDSNRHVVGPFCLPGKQRTVPGVTMRIHAIPRGTIYPDPYAPYTELEL